jgi:hypothetical protein
LREISLRFRAREIGARLIGRRLERALIDRHQKIAGLHKLTIGEMNFFEIAGNARADFNRVNSHEAADIFVEVDDLALDRGSDRHLRCGWCGRRPLAAGGKQKGQRNCGAEGRCRAVHGWALAMAGRRISYTGGTG